MSEKTAPALARLDELLPLLKSLPAGPDTDELIDTAEALRRAVAAFHMEAIRFRMHTVDRLLRKRNEPGIDRVFSDVRHELEAAGFHTRSHAAP
jgi:hypothetical protein